MDIPGIYDISAFRRLVNEYQSAMNGNEDCARVPSPHSHPSVLFAYTQVRDDAEAALSLLNHIKYDDREIYGMLQTLTQAIERRLSSEPNTAEDDAKASLSAFLGKDIIVNDWNSFLAGNSKLSCLTLEAQLMKCNVNSVLREQDYVADDFCAALSKVLCTYVDDLAREAQWYNVKNPEKVLQSFIHCSANGNVREKSTFVSVEKEHGKFLNELGYVTPRADNPELFVVSFDDHGAIHGLSNGPGLNVAGVSNSLLHRWETACLLYESLSGKSINDYVSEVTRKNTITKKKKKFLGGLFDSFH